jgi:hypothetical protein
LATGDVFEEGVEQFEHAPAGVVGEIGGAVDGSCELGGYGCAFEHSACVHFG